MTAHTEAMAADGGHEGPVIRRTWLFLPLFAPFGISSGYVTVTLGFLLGKAGLPVLTIAGLIALSVWPQTWKILSGRRSSTPSAIPSSGTVWVQHWWV